MGLEIEKKFLVKHTDFLQSETGVRMVQGYMRTGGNPGVRVRLVEQQAFLTIKSAVSPDGVRHEFEYPIPLEDGREMLRLFCGGPTIDKVRYKVTHGGFVWEVDVFAGENAGLVIAEIELEEVNQPFPLPPWVDREVSDNRRYSNSRLARYPYSRWSPEEKGE